MSKTVKKFVAVAMMPSSGDKVAAESESMTLDEDVRWLASQELPDPFLERLRDRAAQHRAPASAAR